MARIGSGGMGDVYEAVHTQDGSAAAVKVLHAKLAGDAAVEQRFLREAQAANRVDHPAIVRIDNVGRTDEQRPFLVMELLDGTSLDKAEKKSIAAACSIVADVLDALVAVHASGVIHRDLKPGNIFLTTMGRTVVLDFGIAKLLDDSGVGLTQAGSTLGTPRYMAPEQVRGLPVGPAADVYAVGVVLFELLCGRPPFDGATIDVERQHLQQRPPPPRALRPEIPIEVQDVLLAALAKDPARRPSAAAMRDALKAAFEKEAPTLEEPGRRGHSPAPARPKTPTAGPGGLGGRTFGSFTLQQCIGEGGFGAVYAATQAGIDRQAVVKVLHPHHQRSSSMTERFLREAKLASSLDHPYAAHVYAYGAEPDGYMWIAMELVHGTPLDRMLRATGPLPLDQFVPLLDRICEVVHTAHEQGIVHRDLKPANVMVISRANRLLPKLLDLGLAKMLVAGVEPSAAIARDQPTLELDAVSTSSEDLGITRRGAIMGTPAYMAPEQWQDASLSTSRSDVYALGVLAYECLSGHPPFESTDIRALEWVHREEPPPPLDAKFPRALDAAIAKALAKRPQDRYESALELATAVRAASGLDSEPAHVPRVAATQRDAALLASPQPIADALAVLDAATDLHGARVALFQLARTIIRTLGLLALALYPRTRSKTPTELAGRLRTLYGGSLSDSEWLELGSRLLAGWVEHRDTCPMPELVDAFYDEAGRRDLDEMVELALREVSSEQEFLDLLERGTTTIGRILERILFLRNYPMVVAVAPGLAESWMGARSPTRLTLAVSGELSLGEPVIVNRDGAAVVRLAPLFLLRPPTPGAPIEMFAFEGRDARGARYVCAGSAFEHRDDAVLEWLRARFGTLAELDRGPWSRRNIALAAIGVAGLGIGAASLVLLNKKAASAADPCAQPRAQVAAIWTPARKAQLETAFKATGVGYAAEAWQSTARAIDTYATQLGELGEDSCRKHDDPGEQRVICFSNRRRDLDALLGLFSRADSTTVSHAVSSVEGLEEPRTCLTIAAALSLPKDPAVQQQIKEIDQAASLAELNLTSGKYEESQRLANDAVARARKVEHAPLLAKALLIQGRAQWQTGHMKEASDTFREAATVAERAKDDAAKARALTWKTMVTGVELYDYPVAELLADLARASIDRAGPGNEATEAMLEYDLGMMEIRRGHPQQALDQELKALHLREQTFGQLHGEVGATLIQIGIALRQLERYDEALAQQRRAITLLEGTYGAGHPFVAQALSEVGSVYLAQGKQDLAIVTYEDVVKRLKASVGPQHPDVAVALNNIGVALLSPDNVSTPIIKQAIEHFEEALAIEKAILGPNVREIAETMQNIGRAQLRLGDVAALESLTRALEIQKQQSELPNDIGDLYFDMARAASLANKPADAKSFANEAIKEYEARDRPLDANEVRSWQGQLR